VFRHRYSRRAGVLARCTRRSEASPTTRRTWESQLGEAARIGGQGQNEMNARKHRKCKQAKETDRLEPKGQQSGSESVTQADANSELPVYRADLNHPVEVTERGNAANLARGRNRQTLP
jgi:hypothetical protein